MEEKRMNVDKISKTVFNYIVVVAVIFIIADIVRSQQNNTVPQIRKYMEHYAFNIYQVIQKEDTGEEDTAPFDKNGFLFSDSAERYLTRDEIYALKEVENYKFKQLLEFARKEIYARHGFLFNKKEKYYKFYMQYDWYSGMKHKRLRVVKKELNKYEKKNIKKIKKIISIEAKKASDKKK